MRILVVEDEPKIANFIAKGLRAEHYLVDIAYDGSTAIEEALINQYDIIILDYMLPKKNGLQVVTEIRKNKCESKVIMLTAIDGINDKVNILNAGANDYMVKPFAFEELLARIRVQLRNNITENDTILKADDLEMNLKTHEVKRNGDLIDLSAKEYALLEHFLQNKNKLILRTELWDRVWDMPIENFSNVVDVYVYYLRNKIDKAYPKKLIHTIHGKGYILKSDD